MKLDNCCGTYTLILQVKHQLRIEVGALGLLDIHAGYYNYVGSAFGPGGIRARINHHLSPARKSRWHIDYLHQKAEVVEIWFTCDPVKREHEWAGIFAAIPGMTIPFPGFGSSDCQCISHLFHVKNYPRFGEFHERLQALYPDHGMIQRMRRKKANSG